MESAQELDARRPFATKDGLEADEATEISAHIDTLTTAKDTFDKTAGIKRKRGQTVSAADQAKAGVKRASDDLTAAMGRVIARQRPEHPADTSIPQLPKAARQIGKRMMALLEEGLGDDEARQSAGYAEQLADNLSEIRDALELDEVILENKIWRPTSRKPAGVEEGKWPDLKRKMTLSIILFYPLILLLTCLFQQP